MAMDVEDSPEQTLANLQFQGKISVLIRSLPPRRLREMRLLKNSNQFWRKKMQDGNNDRLPKDGVEAQGMLIKAFYEKYGDDILPIVDRILGLQGRALGLRVKSKLPDNRLSTVANVFMKNFDPATSKALSITDSEIKLWGCKCPFGLENTSRKLCEAVMAIDREYFYVATDGKTSLKILKTMAEGANECETVYTLQQE